MKDDLFKALELATQAYDAAKNIQQRANRDETAALNKLNEAQKAVDEYVAGLKKGAPRSSRWQESNRSVGVANP